MWNSWFRSDVLDTGTLQPASERRECCAARAPLFRRPLATQPAAYPRRMPARDYPDTCWSRRARASHGLPSRIV
jgi:hypothetical protein